MVAEINQAMVNIKQAFDVIGTEMTRVLSLLKEPFAPLREGTGFDAGLSGDIQVNIALRKIITLGGIAQMQDIYAAVELAANERGYTLSRQGRHSLRFFVNRKAVDAGYIYPHDPARPGWRITPAGRARVAALH